MISHGSTSTLIPVCAAAVMAFGSLLAAAPAEADGAGGSPSGPVGGDQGGAVLSQINATRAANGCGPVVANPQLTASAARHANDMLENGVADHTG